MYLKCVYVPCSRLRTDETETSETSRVVDVTLTLLLVGVTNPPTNQRGVPAADLR